MTEPKDPFSELMEAAVQLHELYETWVKAGFTEDQALRLIAYTMSSGFRKDEDGE